MSNETLTLSLSNLLTLRKRPEEKAAAEEQLTGAQEEAMFKAHLIGAWQVHSGMSTGGWGGLW